MTKKVKKAERTTKSGDEVYDDTDEQEEDWAEDDSQQAKENPQAAEHERAASVQQTEAQLTEPPPPEIADVMPTQVYNANLNRQLGERGNETEVDAEQLAEQDRKADAERTEQLAKEAEQPGPATEQPVAEREALPSNEELHGMRRSELDELAEARGVDVSGASNKEDVIDLLRKDARKRKRED